jgi:hypothetical protein
MRRTAYRRGCELTLAASNGPSLTGSTANSKRIAAARHSWSERPQSPRADVGVPYAAVACVEWLISILSNHSRPELRMTVTFTFDRNASGVPSGVSLALDRRNRPPIDQVFRTGNRTRAWRD